MKSSGKTTYQFGIFFLLLLAFNSCESHDKSRGENEYESAKEGLTKYVNPLIGTKNMGHTFPGATVPFGMVQLSPETNIQPMFVNGQYNRDTYKYCSGYQYSDSTIFGFSHTHFSGTGHSDLGDFLVMPTTGKLQLNPGTANARGSGFHSGFSHVNEYAEPGYYRVKLDKYNIQAELTSSERVGFHQYTFPKSDSAHIILDLVYNIYNHDDKNIWTFIRVENDSLITGYRQTNGWARTRTVYFAMEFSKPFSSYGHKKYDSVIYTGFYRRFDETKSFPEMAGKNIRAHFDFQTEANDKILIKFALSSVSTAGALENMRAEIPDWDFDNTKTESHEKWERELAKIIVETQKPEDKEVFYTALYHTMLSPVIFEDDDGKYRGLDQNIYYSGEFTNYSIFSLWDTFRALHPLFNLIHPSTNTSMIESMLAHYDQSVHHVLPIWSHYANENWCMIGYHSVSVIADAIAKGNTNFDVDKALAAAIQSSNLRYYDGLNDYVSLGFVPADNQSSSVSKTLEFAYDDWCIAQIANFTGDAKMEEKYLKRANNFLNHFDTCSRFMKPRYSNGDWVTDFDPLDTHGQGFIEGNAWTYSLFVPHQIEKLVEINGGKNTFEQHLDSLFTMELDDKYIEKNEDITRDGIIGNYVHGNEPGHHIPYLYNWTNSPWKTQERVRMIMETMYGNSVDGLCGNDDAGQMSAWYVFSALGFYPVCPGSDRYEIGSPLIESALINLENGEQLSIKTVNQGKENVFVEKVTINGNELTRNYLLHDELIKGGEIVFYLTNISPSE